MLSKNINISTTQQGSLTTEVLDSTVVVSI